MPSAKILERKKKIVEEIKNKISSSEAVLFFDYRGLTDSEMKELRTKLRDADSDMKIYKNTLTSLALKDLEYEIGELTGPKAIAYSDDLISPIKVIVDFAKEHESLEVKMGILNNEISDIETINKFASIPSREGLLTMLAGALIGIPKDLAIGLNMIAEEKEGN